MGVFGAAMDENDVGGFHFLYEFGCLLAVGVGGETDLGYVEVDGDWAVALHAFDEVTLFEIVSYGALGTIACDDNPIPGIMAPPLQQRPGLSTLQHAGRAHHHHGIAFLG